MIAHRCKNCRWWDNEHIRIKYILKLEYIPNPGICRKHKPGAIKIKETYIGIQPIMDENDYCGEHREEVKK